MGGIAAAAFISPMAANAQAIISNPGRYDGGRLSIQTQTGTNCSSTAPDRASVGVAAGYEDRDSYNYYGNTNGYDNRGFVGGVHISIPFGGTDPGNCRNILAMEEQRARLDMAVTLYEAGGMTAEELKGLAREVKGIVLTSSEAPAPRTPSEDVSDED